MTGRQRPPGPPLEHRVLLTAALCLLAYGAVMVYSASSAPLVLSGHGGDGTRFLARYLMYGGLGLALMLTLARLDISLERVAGPLLCASFLMLVAVLVPGVGVRVNGASRWLGPGPLQFQPSELMKLALVLYESRLLANPCRLRTLRDLRPLLLVVGSACVLVAAEPDLGTAIVIALTAATMLITAGVPLRVLGRIVVIGAVLIGVFALAAPYRRARLTSFLDPWSHAASTGFQAVQGQIALGSGGLFGEGLGRSVQKALFLPEAHTDFILAIIGEELGVAGILALLTLYGLVAWAGLRVARRMVDPQRCLLAVGLTSLIVCEALFNIFTVLGLAPLAGVPLPFISYGSTNLLVMLASMGLLMRLADDRRVAVARPYAPVASATDRGERARARAARRAA